FSLENTGVTNIEKTRRDLNQAVVAKAEGRGEVKTLTAAPKVYQQAVEAARQDLQGQLMIAQAKAQDSKGEDERARFETQARQIQSELDLLRDENVVVLDTPQTQVQTYRTEAQAEQLKPEQAVAVERVLNERVEGGFVDNTGRVVVFADTAERNFDYAVKTEQANLIQDSVKARVAETVKHEVAAAANQYSTDAANIEAARTRIADLGLPTQASLTGREGDKTEVMDASSVTAMLSGQKHEVRPFDRRREVAPRNWEVVFPETVFKAQNISFQEEKLISASRARESFVHGFLLNQPQLEVESAISRVLKKPVNLDDVSDRITLSYFDEGTNKDVFKVTMTAQNGEQFTFKLAHKQPKKGGDISPRETVNLSAVSDVSGAVPGFGGRYEYNGRAFYIEEFIEGKTVRQINQQGGLTHAIREKSVKTILEVSKTLHDLGEAEDMPKDIHTGNVMIRDRDGSAVMVDIGNNYVPVGQGVQNLVRFYGYLGENKDKGSNEFIYQALLDAYGREDGLRYLQSNVDHIKAAMAYDQKTGREAGVTSPKKKQIREQRDEPALRTEDSLQVVQEMEDFIRRVSSSPSSDLVRGTNAAVIAPAVTYKVSPPQMDRPVLEKTFVSPQFVHDLKVLGVRDENISKVEIGQGVGGREKTFYPVTAGDQKVAVVVIGGGQENVDRSYEFQKLVSQKLLGVTQTPVSLQKYPGGVGVKVEELIPGPSLEIISRRLYERAAKPEVDEATRGKMIATAQALTRKSVMRYVRLWDQFGMTVDTDPSNVKFKASSEKRFGMPVIVDLDAPQEFDPSMPEEFTRSSKTASELIESIGDPFGNGTVSYDAVMDEYVAKAVRQGKTVEAGKQEGVRVLREALAEFKAKAAPTVGMNFTQIYTDQLTSYIDGDGLKNYEYVDHRIERMNLPVMSETEAVRTAARDQLEMIKTRQTLASAGTNSAVLSEAPRSALAAAVDLKTVLPVNAETRRPELKVVSSDKNYVIVASEPKESVVPGRMQSHFNVYATDAQGKVEMSNGEPRVIGD
ncbi:MAG TPA: hypothetical protein P5246_04240, partial [Candidatus Omnitrophota bacterium]|nr:hypothetical protein [Candidatus Omnitrophota bacterium]